MFILPSGGKVCKPNIQISLTNLTVNANYPGQTQASAVYSLRADGFVYTGAYTTTQLFTVGTQWCKPSLYAPNYEAYVTTNFPLSFGTVNQWVPLNVDQYWRLTVTGPAGDAQAGLTVQIRRVGSTAVLATASVTLIAFSSIA